MAQTDRHRELVFASVDHVCGYSVPPAACGCKRIRDWLLIASEIERLRWALQRLPQSAEEIPDELI
jgi:hypothetical protein